MEKRLVIIEESLLMLLKTKDRLSVQQPLQIKRGIEHQGPIYESNYHVPFESIEMHKELIDQFSREGVISMLYGPRQYGKLALARELSRNQNLNVCYIIFESSLSRIPNFWTYLATYIVPEYDSEVNSSIDFRRLMGLSYAKTGKKLLLMIDEFDLLLTYNVQLFTDFANFIRSSIVSEWFYSFLGIGNYELSNLVLKMTGNSGGPFNVDKTVLAVPFNENQMMQFFHSLQWKFREDIMKLIIDYSGGAPGVFVSLIKFAIDFGYHRKTVRDWVNHFHFEGVSSEYYACYNKTYIRIKKDIEDRPYLLESLSNALKSNKILGREKSHYHELLAMGVLNVYHIPQHEPYIWFSSPMMYSMCCTIFKTRDIKFQHPLPEDPVELLSLSVNYMDSHTLIDKMAQNLKSPSEAVFQVELYSVFRSLFTSQKNLFYKVIPEAKILNESLRCDLLLKTGKIFAYEIKVHLLTINEIYSAAKQALHYKLLFNIDEMLVVNFVPIGHNIISTIGAFEDIPGIEIAHVRYDPDCTAFNLVRGE